MTENGIVTEQLFSTRLLLNDRTSCQHVNPDEVRRVGYEAGDDPRRRATTFTDRLANSCAQALGDRVSAVILHGSLALDALRQAVASLQGEAPCRVDLRVVTRTVAAFPTPAPAMEVSIALHPGQPLEVETRMTGESDLVVEFSLVRVHGRSIVGANPRSLIGAVPREWVVEVGDRQLAAWEQLTDDAENAELMVLTTCRIWRFNAEGVHSSKAEAGHWALGRDPSLTAVEEARRQRRGDPDVTIGEDDIRHLLSRVRREIANRSA
jgi:hypothetical protein